MDDLLHRKEKLIITTIDIIDEIGILGLSTREIARREGVSEATLFRHYKSKKVLLIAVLEYYSQFDNDIYLASGLKQATPMEALRFFVKSYTEYYENYPAITSIMQLMDVFRGEPELTETIKNILSRRTEILKQLIENAQESGEIDPSVDSNLITDIITGFSREICLNWRLNKLNFSLMDRTLKTLDTLLSSLNRINVNEL